MKTLRKKTKNNFHGFTLIEVLVAVALFVTIITLAMGALFQAQSFGARMSANQVILDGMNLSFETVTRDIRYGTLFDCENVVPVIKPDLKRKSCKFDIGVSGNPGTVIIFRPVNAVDPDDRIGYYASSSKIYKWSYINHTISEQSVTSDEVKIKTLQFFVTGANTTQQAVDTGNKENDNVANVDTLQPVINIMATGETSIVKKPNDKVKFQLQTTVAPRGIDN